MNQEMIFQFLNDRASSWPLIGLIVFIIALLVRRVLLHDLLRDIKLRNHVWFHAIQSKYQKRALTGWVLFILSLSGFMALWRFEWFFLKYERLSFWILLFTLLLMISFIGHIQCYARAIFEVLQDDKMKEREF